MEFKLTTKKPNLIALILLISFPSFVAVFISPALPAISHTLSLNDVEAQHLISASILGYALGQLLYSPIANRFGRKHAIYAGLTLYFIGMAICLIGIKLANIDIMIISRLITGLGASVGMVITFTIINDFYHSHQARGVVSYTVLAYAFMPAVANFLGGVITDTFGWQMCFYFLILYGVLILAAGTVLPETLMDRDITALKLKRLLRNYLNGFTAKQLILFSIVYGMMASYIYVIASGSPFIAIEKIHMSPALYGLVLLLPYCGQVIGALSAGRLNRYFEGNEVLYIGFGFISLGSIVMLISFWLGWINELSLFLPLLLIMLGLPMTYSIVTVKAQENFADKATGSAVMSFITMVTALLANALYTHLPENSVLMMPAVFIGLIVLANIIFPLADKA